MTEEARAQDEAGSEAAGTDWESKYREAVAHSREWEKRAKANKGAADELEKLKAEQMTEAERERARADKAEAALAAAQAERDRAGWVSEAAGATGVPADVLTNFDAESAEDLMAKAEAVSGHFKKDSVPVVPGDGRHPERPASATGDSWLRETLPSGLRRA